MVRDLTVQKLPKLLWFQDRASMAWGIETRVPFLDHHLIEFAYSLPPSSMMRGGVSKVLPKRLLQTRCGVNFTDSVKHFVAVPQREWLKESCFSAANDVLDGGRLAQSGLIDYPAFKAAYAAYAAQPELGNSFFVWKMINLEMLLRAFPEAMVSPPAP